MHSELGDFDTIYLDGGSDNGLKIGDRLLALKVLQTKLYHPSDTRHSKNLGDVIKQIGVVRVTQVEPKSAVAVIEKSADSIQVGDRLAPFSEPANMALQLRTDTKSPVTIQSPEARVIYVGDNHTVSGTGDMVIIDQGAKDGLKVGDVLLSARERTWPVGTDQKKRSHHRQDQLPDRPARGREDQRGKRHLPDPPGLRRSDGRRSRHTLTIRPTDASTNGPLRGSFAFGFPARPGLPGWAGGRDGASGSRMRQARLPRPRSGS